MHAIAYAHHVLRLFPNTPDIRLLLYTIQVTRELVKVVGGNAYHRLPRSVFRVSVFRVKWIKKYWGELAWIAYRFGITNVGHLETSPYQPTWLHCELLMCLHKWTQHIADIGRYELSATVPDALNYLSQPSITETEASHRSFLRVVADLPPNVPKRRVRPEAFVRGDVDRFERRPLKAKLLGHY